MNARRKIDERWQKKTTNDHKCWAAGINFCKYPVQGNMTKEDQEVKEQAVDIIIAPAENIENRNEFDDDISFKVVPKRIYGTEKTGITIRVTGSKNISEIFRGVIHQELVFFPGLCIHVPIIISSSVKMQRQPANSNTGNDLKSKQSDNNPAADAWSFYKRHTAYQPA